MLSFDDLTQPKKDIAKITLACILLPFIICLLLTIYSNIKGLPTHHLFTYLVYGGTLIAVSGFTYLLVDNNLKRKVLHLLFVMTLYILLLPITWSIVNIKMELFMYKNRDALEQIANNIISQKWTIEKANYFLGSKYPLTVIGHLENEKTLLFQIDGITDNCSGIAYSKSGKEPSINSCGRLTHWSHLSGN